MIRPRPGVISALSVILLTGCSTLPPPAAVPTAMAAHEVCSAVFVSGFEPDRAFAATVAPQLGPAASLMTVTTDSARKTVTATIAGLYSRRAEYREAFGCAVGPAPTLASAPQIRTAAPKTTRTMAVRPDPALDPVLELAFAESRDGPRRRTYATVILHRGQVVGERYAPGVSADTQLHGWSMTKSVTNALLGVLVQQGRLDMSAPAAVPEWRDPADPRHQITPDDLLRMRSGLDVGQSLIPRWDAPLDPANRIMFAASDMGALSAGRPLKAPVRSVWTYSDGNTAILGRLIRQTAGGGDPAATQAFARRELFDRLGMGLVTLETDATGSPVGATQFYASARDWARLGQLFLDDGMVADTRVLPIGWVAYSTDLTPGSDAFGYGAGFWVTTPARARQTGFPIGSFMARGARGQYVVVVPSSQLVLVKLGDSDTPYGDIEGTASFVKAAVRWAENLPSSGRRSRNEQHAERPLGRPL